MPAPPGSPPGAGGDGVDQGKEVSLAIFWEGEDLFDSVNCPSKDDLMRATGDISFAAS